MSGIAGWIDWERDLSGEQNVLSKMTNAIQHRGPDDEGYWFSGTCSDLVTAVSLSSILPVENSRWFIAQGIIPMYSPLTGLSITLKI